jgi:UrcA family protein
MSKLRLLPLSIVAGAGLLWLASSAVAQPLEIVVTGKAVHKGHHAARTKVDIKGINLATPSGVKEMNRRVAQGVEFVCQTHTAVAKGEQREAKACINSAWASVRPQMDRAVHSARVH